MIQKQSNAMITQWSVSAMVYLYCQCNHLEIGFLDIPMQGYLKCYGKTGPPWVASFPGIGPWVVKKGKCELSTASIPLLLYCEDSSCDFHHDNRLLPQTVSQIILLFLKCFYQSTLSQWQQCTYGNALLTLMSSEVSSTLLRKIWGKYSLQSSTPTVQVWVIQEEVENFTVFIC